MKKKNIIITIAASAALIIGASATVFAYSHISAPEILANITGQSTEDIIAKRNDTGKTYGEIAKDAGKLDEFKQERINAGKASLNEDVANGDITQEQADKYLADLEVRLANCDGTGNNCPNQDSCDIDHSAYHNGGTYNRSHRGSGSGFGSGHHSGRGGRHCAQ